jgi:DNA-binding response OmpR family regulator
MRDRPVVMVVEDDVEMNELERELLAVHGLDGVAAYTGAEALRVWDATGADAVLLDIMLPEIDGLETCRRLRQRHAASLPIIMLSALDSEDCRRMGYEAGADAYFTKPFDPDEVINTIQQLINRNGNQ